MITRGCLILLLDQRTHKIYKSYNTLWAYEIKLHSDLTFNKLNPRWCLKGGAMDRDIYKSHTATCCMHTGACTPRDGPACVSIAL